MSLDLCLFSSYFKGNVIPDDVKIYLNELSSYTSEIIFITTFKPFIYLLNPILKKQKIKVMFVKNEGFDFGMWYKALNKLKNYNYQSILFANDSCVLINPLADFFNWSNEQNAQFLGLISSGEKVYHVQSFFFILKNEAIDIFYNLLKSKGLATSYYDAIKKYELVLSSFFKDAGVRTVVYKDYGTESELNPMFFKIRALLETNFPLIKKQLILGFRRKHNIDTLRSKGFNLTSNEIKSLIISNARYARHYDLKFKASF
jgi:lipopolysaccharide biosynthesis protein